jgi:hypothetical protein
VHPSQPIRGFYVRVIVKSRSLVGADSVLGESDIPLSSLVKENCLEGWFPLKQKGSNLAAGSLGSGSVKVRVQWIHTATTLAQYLNEVANE